MKTLTSNFILLLLILISFQKSFAQTFAGGDGTKENPFQISSPEQLNEIRNSLDSHFTLVNNIDLAFDTQNPEGLFWNDSLGWDPIGDRQFFFSGSLKGSGFIIEGLTINSPDARVIGLFAGISENGEIQNLKITNLRIEGQSEIGGLVGKNYGLIENCLVSGEVFGGQKIGGLIGGNYGVVKDNQANVDITGGNRVGGLIGENEGVVVNNIAIGSIEGLSYVGGLIGSSIYIKEIVNNIHLGGVKGTIGVGGLVGITNGNIVENNYSIGNVEGDQWVGGLIGVKTGNTSYNYSVGEVNGEIGSGNLIGFDESGLSVSNFWDSSFSNLNTEEEKGLSTTQMLMQSSFEGWDFDSTWAINEGETYPYLKNNMQDPLPAPIITSNENELDVNIKSFELDQNYPNPFNPSTKISYRLKTSGNVLLEIYNMIGRKVSTLVDRQQLRGNYEVNFDASNLSTGIYLYRLKVNGEVFTKRMLLLK
ncbi:MAG: T9SS type A sorting domain-containing protein [Balneolaceae bacterium]